MCLAFAALQRGPTGAAAPPRRVACARLTLERLLVPTLAAGLCLSAAVCCSSLPRAAFSVGRVEAVRARLARARPPSSFTPKRQCTRSASICAFATHLRGSAAATTPREASLRQVGHLRCAAGFNKVDPKNHSFEC